MQTSVQQSSAPELLISPPRESLDPVHPGDSCHNEDHPADHATEDQLLSSQGFILSPSVAVAMPERPPAVVASTPEDVLRDLETSDGKPTMPIVVSSRRKHASPSGPSSDRDHSKEDPPADHAPT